MIAKTSRVIIHILAAAVVGLFLLAGFATWQLARGPVSLAFLAPYVESALSSETGLVRLQDTVLTWDGEDRSLDVRALGLDFLDPDGRPLAQVPEASIRFSVSALLQGLIAPTSLEVRGARLRLTRAADGSVEFGVESLAGDGEQTTGGAMAPLVRELLDPPDATRRTGYLTRLSVVDAAIEVIDEAAGTRWSARHGNIALSRDDNGIVAELSMEVAAAGDSGLLVARGVFDNSRDSADLAMTLVDFPTRILSRLEPQLAPFDSIDMVLNGTVSVTVDRNVRLRSARFDLRGGSGTIGLPGATTEPLAVDRAAIRGWFDQDVRLLTLEAGEVVVDGRRTRLAGTAQRAAEETTVTLELVELAPAMLAQAAPRLALFDRLGLPIAGTVKLSLSNDNALREATFDLTGGAGPLSLPEFYPEPLPITSLHAKGRVEGAFDRLVLEDLTIASRGLEGTLKVVAERVGETMAVQVDAAASAVPIDDIDPFWPAGMKQAAMRWVTGNLTDGIVDHATMRVNATAEAGQVTVTEVGGDMVFSGISVHFLRPMEPVVGAAGRATFDRSGLDIDIEASTGGLRDLDLEEGRIDIVGLDSGDERVGIFLTVSGPVKDALEVLDQAPLHYMTRLGLDPAGASGRQRANLVFDIPLKSGLTFADIGVAGAASLIDYAHPEGFRGQPISDGRLTLAVDKTQLSIDGDLVIGGTAVKASQTLNFTPGAEFKRRFQVQGMLDGPDRRRLGIDLALLSGPVGYGLAYTEFADGSAMGGVDLDLGAAAIEIAPFKWRKPAGLATRGFVEFESAADGPLQVTRFDIQSRSLVAMGSMEFRDEAGVTVPARLNFERLIFDESDVFGSVTWAADGSRDISVGGNSLDLRPIIEGLDGDAGGAANGAALRITVSERTPLLTVRLGQLTRVNNVVGRLEHDGTVWRNVSLLGLLGEAGGTLDLRIIDEGETRRLAVVADNAGAVISALGWTDNLRGGRLELEARFLDAEAGSPLAGRALVQDFKIVKATVLARLLALASFSNIVDTLNGEGIAFDRLEVPFRLTAERLEISEAKLRGSEIGILAGGEIDRTANTIDLVGEVAPAYTLNSLLGRIPLIGDVFTGGGDGVFAATYKVDGAVSDPRIVVNPLSVLTPGFTRRILNGFGGARPAGDQDDAIQEPWDRPDQN